MFCKLGMLQKERNGDDTKKEGKKMLDLASNAITKQSHL